MKPIEEKLIKEIPSKLWEVSKLRHALFTPVEFPDLCRQVIREYFSKNPLFSSKETTGSETPETDAALREMDGDYYCDGLMRPNVSFELERSRNALRAENERLKEELEQWKSLCADFNDFSVSPSRASKENQMFDLTVDRYWKMIKAATPPTEEKGKE